MKIKSLIFLFTAFASLSASADSVDKFPDGTVVPKWFSENNEETNLSQMGKQYVVTDYDVIDDSTKVQTRELQNLIDIAWGEGGGVIVIPKGKTILSGALFFRPKVNLYIEEGGKLKGSDDICDFGILPTRIEGQSLKYYCALVNANGIDGFKIAGKGTIDGNGLRYWRSFWLRRKWNPKCTNMDEQRPRLVYISNCKNVKLSGVTLQNSPFWTTHIYNSENVKLINLNIFSPAAPTKAPSTDAIDLDVVNNVLVKGCYMEVNDDAIALNGGKGPYADKDSTNGANTNIIIEDCSYGFVHGCLTCGSEAIHCNNIILRRCTMDGTNRLLWLKMRPDTPQLYENILVEDVVGTTSHFIYVHPWTQFFDLKGREDIPMSYSKNVTIRNCNVGCGVFFDVERKDDQYLMSNFKFENLKISAKKDGFNKEAIKNFKVKNVVVNGEKK